MARDTNKLLQHLLNNESSKKDFIELVQKTKSNWDMAKLLREGKFENTTWYVSYQTVGNIMKKLGYVGRRGKPATKLESIAKEKPQWYYDQPGMN
jgi:fructose-1-phosphate kinase PfkB-like protein